MHGVQLVDIIPAQLVIVVDIRVHIETIQVFREIDDLLHTAGMVAPSFYKLKSR